jgi:MFS transporter, FSR family, fosmidomycin resistance protein
VNLPRKPLFWAVSLGHLVNDMFMSMGPVLLAFISVSILPMTNTQIGLTVSAAQLVGAVCQPGFGLLADRTGGRWLGAGGVMWVVGFFMLALVGAQTGYFWLLFIPFVASALGSGAFHPTGSMHAADSDKTRAASNVAYFFLLGQIGLAAGPALAGILLDVANPTTHHLFTGVFAPVYDGSIQWWGTITPIYALSLIALPVIVWMFLIVPGSRSYSTVRQANDAERANGPAFSLPVKALLILVVMVTLRSLGQPGSVTFIPVLFQNKGWTPAEYGAITSSFWLASGFAGVIFGNLADRFDRRAVVAVSMAISAPAFFLLPVIDGAPAFAMAIIAGGLSGGSHSIIVVLAQELIPGAKGFASGAILGLIFGTGALGSFLMGVLSDLMGLDATFQVVAATILASAVVALLLPARKPPTALAADINTETQTRSAAEVAT